MSTDPRARSWVEVNASALRRNLARIRVEAGSGTGLLPLVKADAYGVGIRQAVAALEGEEPWGYGVATVDEGELIRATGVTRPILVLSPVPPAAVRDGMRAGLTLSVSSVPALAEVVLAARELSASGELSGLAAVHVEVDTGMGRSGFDWRTAESWGREVHDLTQSGVLWEGIFSHLHSADRPGDSSVDEQVRRFRRALDQLDGLGVTNRILHLNNSAAALRRVGSGWGLVRPGIFLYGGVAGDELPDPEEVVAVRARVVLVRSVPAGTSVGYGAEYSSIGVERWATVGIGYGDGLPRALGNRGSGLVRGRRVPIIGRISMDLTVVDISHLPFDVEVGEVVTFVGSDEGGRISLEEIADLSGTINYEILTGMSPRLPRVWVEGAAIRD